MLASYIAKQVSLSFRNTIHNAYGNVKHDYGLRSGSFKTMGHLSDEIKNFDGETFLLDTPAHHLIVTRYR